MSGRPDFIGAIDIAQQSADYLTQRNKLGKLHQLRSTLAGGRGDVLTLTEEGKGIFLSAHFNCSKECVVSTPTDEMRVIIDEDYEYIATPETLYQKKAFTRYNGGVALTTYNPIDGIWSVYFDINQTFEVEFKIRYTINSWCGMICGYEVYYCLIEE